MRGRHNQQPGELQHRRRFSQNTANPGITVPGDNGQCDRTITVCKQVSQNNDGIVDDIASLTFGVSGNTKPGQPISVGVSTVAEGGTAKCVDITALRKDAITFSEPTSAPLGTGWTLTGVAGASSFSIANRTATVNADTSDNPAAVMVTFTNKHDFATKTITVCKAFEANTDGVADTFTFTATVTRAARTSSTGLTA